MKNLIYIFFGAVFIISTIKPNNLHPAQYLSQSQNEIDSTFIVSRKENPYNGILRYKYQWKDKSGMNRILISFIDTTYNEGLGKYEIFAYQYRINGNNWERIWQMNDFVKGVGCDLSIEIKQKKIVDIDADGINEFYVLYTLDNRCDAVGVKTKLIAFKNQTKLAVRGISQQYMMPPEHVYNELMRKQNQKPMSYKAVDSGPFSKDNIFVKYISDQWDKFIKLENDKNKREN